MAFLIRECHVLLFKDNLFSFRYSAYGEELLHWGPLADDNLIRFPSEWSNPVTGLMDYLYRSCNPVDGRWTQRDPIAEQGGINLYNFVRACRHNIKLD